MVMNNPAVQNLDDVTLRAENGQIVVEDAATYERLDIDTDRTLLRDHDGNLLYESVDASHNRLHAKDDQPLQIQDQAAGATAIEYNPVSATLDLQTADLNLGGQNLIGSIGGTPTWTGDHQFNEGLSIATGQEIDDGSGVDRIEFNSGQTFLNAEGGTSMIQAKEDGPNRLYARSSANWQIRDNDGGFNAVEYQTATSTPGTLELTNANLTVPTADIESGASEGAIEVDSKGSLADTGKAQLSRDALVQGYAMIQDTTNSASVMVYLAGAGNSAEIIHDSGAETNFSTTEGNQGTTNVYYDSINNRYEIENETGASATYSVEVLKA